MYVQRCCFANLTNCLFVFLIAVTIVIALTSYFKYEGNIRYKWPSAWSFHFNPQTTYGRITKEHVINLTEFPVWQ